jgi:hypothetical protein
MSRAGVALLLAFASLAWAPPEPTKVTGCHVDGLLPDRACTPGAVETTDRRVVCGSSTRGRRNVSRELHRAAFVTYGLPPREPPGAFEVDHLIPLELGGSNDLANLWPEASPGFHDKDRVENELHRRVCAGTMSLDDAQRAIAINRARVFVTFGGLAAVVRQLSVCWWFWSPSPRALPGRSSSLAQAERRLSRSRWMLVASEGRATLCYRAGPMRAGSTGSIRLFDGRRGSRRRPPITDVDWASGPGVS